MSSVSLQAQKDTALSQSGAEEVPRIGPNAVIQTLRAIRELESTEAADRIAKRAGLPDREPASMIPEERFVRLVHVVRDELSADRAQPILARAGRLTADYVVANRIPASFRRLLELLPARLALPLLLAAFRRHAWTFSGRSNYDVVGAWPGEIVLDDAPTCRGTDRGILTGEYYAAAFEGLLSLACGHIRVVEVACRSEGSNACRFAIQIRRDT